MLLWWLGAIALVVVGGGIGRKLAVPDAVIWCVLGVGAGFVPGSDGLKLDPHMALFILLPPLVYASAVRLPWADFRENLRPISLLAIGLVSMNTMVVAVVAHYLGGFSWAVATALGALISPTDPVAASAVAARMGLPHRLVAILEGEGLVNDAVALTILRLAIAAAAASAHFSIAGGITRFLMILIGEPLYGCLIGFAVLMLRTRIEDPRLEVTVSLLTPFGAYLLPEYLGGSGILATVAAGMYIGERLSDVVPAGTRLHSTSVWEIVVFLLNGVLFLAAGMRLRQVLQPEYLSKEYLRLGLVVAGTAVLLRAAWCASAWRLVRSRDMLPARQMLVIAWAGMRGPISLAAALSIPAFDNGVHPPYLEALVFLTAIVIVVTLVIQGVALPYVVRLLGVSHDAENDLQEERRQLALGEAEAAKTAIDCVSRLEKDGVISSDKAKNLERYYRSRPQADNAADGDSYARRQVISAERARIHELRREGRINEQTLKRLERKLDLRETEL
jgi:Na+/H+ antiporter